MEDNFDDNIVTLKIDSWDKPEVNKPKIKGLHAEGVPDYFDIYSGETWIGGCDYNSDDALPFVTSNGKLYVGGSGLGHYSCNYSLKDSDNGDYAFGRLWFCINQYSQDDYDDEREHEVKPPFPYSVLSFWNEDEEHTIDTKLVDELLAKYGIDKNKVLVASFEEDDCGKIYPYTEWNFRITKANERQKDVRAMHLMNAHDKHDATTNFRANRDRKIGQKLTNDKGQEMPVAQYRSMIYSENINRIIRNVLREYIDKNAKGIIF